MQDIELSNHLCGTSGYRIIYAGHRITGAPMRSIGLPDHLFIVSSSVDYFVCKNILELINRSKQIPG